VKGAPRLLDEHLLHLERAVGLKPRLRRDQVDEHVVRRARPHRRLGPRGPADAAARGVPVRAAAGSACSAPTGASTKWASAWHCECGKFTFKTIDGLVSVRRPGTACVAQYTSEPAMRRCVCAASYASVRHALCTRRRPRGLQCL